jgi:hypothetical protein
MHSRDTIFDSAHTLPNIIENWQYLISCRAAVTAHDAERCEQLTPGNYFVRGLVEAGEWGSEFN